MLRSCRLASNDSGRHAAHRLLRSIAKHRTPEAAFDYADGSAEAELSLRRGRSIELVDRAVRVGFDTALGARSTLVGRAYLYGLMAGGEPGVTRAIDILSEQITRTMRLLGATSLDELTPSHVTQLERFVPRARP